MSITNIKSQKKILQYTSLKLKFSKVVARKYLAADLYRLELSSARPAAHFTLHSTVKSSLLFLVDKKLSFLLNYKAIFKLSFLTSVMSKTLSTLFT